MLIKPCSDEGVRPIRNVENFSAWAIPKLSKTNAPGFQQPKEGAEKEHELSEVEIEEIRIAELKAIRQEAYNEGFSLGQKEGLAAIKEKVEHESALIQKLFSELSEPLKQCEESTKQQLLELSFAIARQIVRRELQQDPSQLIAIIRDALKLLPIGNQSVNIALNPEDARMIKDKILIGSDSKSNEDPEESAWKIKEDPAVECGSCQVTTKNSKIDASIDKQVAILFSRIVGGQRSHEMNHVEQCDVTTKNQEDVIDAPVRVDSVEVSELETPAFIDIEPNDAKPNDAKPDDIEPSNTKANDSNINPSKLDKPNHSNTKEQEENKNGTKQKQTSENRITQNRVTQDGTPQSGQSETFVQEQGKKENQTIEIKSNKSIHKLDEHPESKK